MLTVIKPTPGRVVWYYPDRDDILAIGLPKGEPLAAMVVRVLSERDVHLVVFDIWGSPIGRHPVVLLQEGDVTPSMGGFAAWPPYQQGQAVKVEELLKAVKTEELLKSNTFLRDHPELFEAE